MHSGKSKWAVEMTVGGQLGDSAKARCPKLTKPPLENPQSYAVYSQRRPAFRRTSVNEGSYLIQRFRVSKFGAHLKTVPEYDRRQGLKRAGPKIRLCFRGYSAYLTSLVGLKSPMLYQLSYPSTK